MLIFPPILKHLELYCPEGGGHRPPRPLPHFKLRPCLYYQTIFSKSGSKRKWHRIIWEALINTVHCLKATALQNECESHFCPTNHTVGTDYVMLFTANPSPRRDPPCIIRKEQLSRRFSPSTELTSMRYVGHNNHTTSVQLTGCPKICILLFVSIHEYSEERPQIALIPLTPFDHYYPGT